MQAKDRAKYYRDFLTWGSCHKCGKLCLLTYIYNGEARVCNYAEINYYDLPDGQVLVEPGGFEYCDNSESVDCLWAPPDEKTRGFVRHFETCKGSKG